MNTRDKLIDRCIKKWYKSLDDSYIMTRAIDGTDGRIKQQIVIKKQELEQYEKDGWELFL